MKRHYSLIGLALAIIVVTILLFRQRTHNPATTERPDISETPLPGRPKEASSGNADEQRGRPRNLVGAVESMLSTPITFYGKVVDQRSDPVPYAKVGYGILDKFNASGSVGESAADGDGSFVITGVRGAVISVSVHKEGYHFLEDLSKGSFAYGYGTDTYTKPAPTKENPAVFVLQKMGKIEPLIVVDDHSFRIPKDGTSVVVDLVTGKASRSGQLQVQAWTGERDPGGPRFYDWKCRVSIPGGGIADRKREFEFEAPKDGYQEFLEIVMPKDAERWTADVEKSYFARLSDGRHALINFRMLAAGDHFFRIVSYLNPTPGSRSLEYDSTKRK